LHGSTVEGCGARDPATGQLAATPGQECWVLSAGSSVLGPQCWVLKEWPRWRPSLLGRRQKLHPSGGWRLPQWAICGRQGHAPPLGQRPSSRSSTRPTVPPAWHNHLSEPTPGLGCPSSFERHARLSQSGADDRDGLRAHAVDQAQLRLREPGELLQLGVSPAAARTSRCSVAPPPCCCPALAGRAPGRPSIPPVTSRPAPAAARSCHLPSLPGQSLPRVAHATYGPSRKELAASGPFHLPSLSKRACRG